VISKRPVSRPDEHSLAIAYRFYFNLGIQFVVVNKIKDNVIQLRIETDQWWQWNVWYHRKTLDNPWLNCILLGSVGNHRFLGDFERPEHRIQPSRQPIDRSYQITGTLHSFGLTWSSRRANPSWKYSNPDLEYCRYEFTRKFQCRCKWLYSYNDVSISKSIREIIRLIIDFDWQEYDTIRI
jgi:hypothetical protein